MYLFEWFRVILLWFWEILLWFCVFSQKIFSFFPRKNEILNGISFFREFSDKIEIPFKIPF